MSSSYRCALHNNLWRIFPRIFMKHISHCFSRMTLKAIHYIVTLTVLQTLTNFNAMTRNCGAYPNIFWYLSTEQKSNIGGNKTKYRELSFKHIFGVPTLEHSSHSQIQGYEHENRNSKHSCQFYSISTTPMAIKTDKFKTKSVMIERRCGQIILENIAVNLWLVLRKHLAAIGNEMYIRLSHMQLLVHAFSRIDQVFGSCKWENGLKKFESDKFRSFRIYRDAIGTKEPSPGIQPVVSFFIHYSFLKWFYFEISQSLEFHLLLSWLLMLLTVRSIAYRDSFFLNASISVAFLSIATTYKIIFVWELKIPVVSSLLATSLAHPASISLLKTEPT